MESNSDVTKEILKEFIRTWKECPEIWNNSCEGYRDKFKKNKALDTLLVIYKKIKPDSTRHDIRKKINSLRTNYRREWRKMMRSKSLGGDEEYAPTNWIYHELQFLSDSFAEPDFNLEERVQEKRKCIENYKEESDWNEMDEIDECSESSIDPLTSSPSVKRPKQSIDYQTQSSNYQNQSTEYLIEASENSEEDHVAKIWAKKLKKLDPIQKLYAEKAINDIFFEAELQNLQNRKDD